MSSEGTPPVGDSNNPHDVPAEQQNLAADPVVEADAHAQT